MKKIITISTAVAIIALSTNLYSRDFRVNQLPNGSKFRCSNCHVSSGGGGALNKFGQIVGSKYLSGGNVVWNAELASLDSDNDGYSNGAELGDPKGEWKIGSANPNVPEITNPGNAASIPSDVIENMDDALAGTIEINSVYPNPLSTNSELKYTIGKSGFYKFAIYNNDGILVSDLASGIIDPGTYSMPLQKINQLNSGLYFLVISNENKSVMKKVFKFK